MRRDHQISQEHPVPTSQRHEKETDLEARQRGLCDICHRLQLVAQGTLNPAMVTGDVVVFQKEAQCAVIGTEGGRAFQIRGTLGRDTGRNMGTTEERTSLPLPSSKPGTKRSFTRSSTGAPLSRLGRSLELHVP